MINREKFLEQEGIIEEVFFNFMSEKNYDVRINDGDSIKYLGYGGNAVKDDTFAVLFKLVNFPYPRSFSVFVEDRNGNLVLTGETAAIYSIEADDNIDNKELVNKFKILLNDVYNKYKDYSKENRLDFVYNGLEMERKDYTNFNPNEVKKQEKVDEKGNVNTPIYQLLNEYKEMTESTKDNLEKYLIIQGIYDIYPEISDEEAQLILNFCDKNMTENVNPLTLSHQLTDQFYKGNISKDELEKSLNMDIFEVSFFDKINHYYPISEHEDIEEDIEK